MYLKIGYNNLFFSCTLNPVNAHRRWQTCHKARLCSPKWTEAQHTSDETNHWSHVNDTHGSRIWINNLKQQIYKTLKTTLHLIKSKSKNNMYWDGPQKTSNLSPNNSLSISALFREYEYCKISNDITLRGIITKRLKNGSKFKWVSANCNWFNFTFFFSQQLYSAYYSIASTLAPIMQAATKPTDNQL